MNVFGLYTDNAFNSGRTLFQWINIFSSPFFKSAMLNVEVEPGNNRSYISPFSDFQSFWGYLMWPNGVTMSTCNFVQLIITSKNPSPCNTNKHIGSYSSKKSGNTLNANDLWKCMERITVLQGLSRGKHHSPSQSVERISTYPRKGCDTPPQ